MNLNSEQQQAVDHFKGVCVVTAVPGSGKCIASDSWVFSQTIMLSQIADNQVSSVIGLYDENPSIPKGIKSRDVSEFVDSGMQPVIRLKTKNGYSLTGTYQHPIVVLDELGNLIWKKLEDIREGDKAPIWCNKTCDVDIVRPGKLDNKFYFMGLLLGDGSLSAVNRIRFSCQSELKNVFIGLSREIYDREPLCYRDKRRNDLYNIAINSKSIKDDLIDMFGDIEHGACEKYLTSSMLGGSPQQVASLLRGIFDTDGYVSDRSCGITLCSKKMIDQMHLLLLHFGVYSHKSVKVVCGNNYYRIEVFGEDFRRFMSNIGFSVRHKAELGHAIFDKNRNPNKTIPFMRHHLRELRSEISQFDWWDGRTATVFSDSDAVCMNRYLINDNARNITETSLLRIIDICTEKGFKSETLLYLKYVVENFCFTDVSSVDHIADEFSDFNSREHVFDYVVPESHSFIANGFVNHNTATLTARVTGLVQKRSVDPSNILCLTFTNKAANEMRERISEQAGQAGEKIWVSTFHALCIAILRKYGSRVGIDPNFSIYTEKDQKELMNKVIRMHGYEPTYRTKTINHYCKAVNDFREDVADFESHIQGLAHPAPAVIKEYLELLDKWNAVDFTGILYKTWLLFKRHPKATRILKNKFQFVLVDEMQDTNTIQYEIVHAIVDPDKQRDGNLFVVGDFNQCVYSEEKVNVSEDDGSGSGGSLVSVSASEMPSSGLIESYRNGQYVLQKYSASKSDATQGVKIILESGRSLSVSHKHRIYSTSIVKGSGKPLVYLMYRPDLGFRVGVTQNEKTVYGHRMRGELATKLWVLKVCEDYESALLEEQRVSLKFGVPTLVFQGTGRGLNQDRINHLFAEFGDNGLQVLKHFDLDFQFPLWNAQGSTTRRYSRTQVHVCAHASKGTQVFCEWNDKSLCQPISDLGVSVTRAKPSKHLSERWRCRRFFNKYTEANKFAYKLSKVVNGGISERFTLENQRLFLTTASAIREGCCLPVKDGGLLRTEKVVRVEPLSGEFVSIEVDDSCVFFNTVGVLSHNSIFSWRGAKPENIQRVSHDFDKVMEIVLPRNYRSTSHILQSAQNLIRHNDNARDVHLISERGAGQPVAFKKHSDVESEANYIAAAIQGMKAKNGYSLNDFAILYRTNALSKQPEIALRKYDIPYKIVGGFSFFDRREIKDALAYLSFVANPNDSIQFARAISSPRRSLGSTAIGRIERHCHDHDVSMLEACQSPDVKLTSKMRENLNEFVGVIQKAQQSQASHAGLSSVVSSLLKDSGYYDYIDQEDAKENKTSSKRIDNLDEFLVSVADYEERKPTATIRDFLHTVQILTSDLTDSDDDDAVTLLTMHSAKGLQFPVVFIVGAEKGLIPHQMALAERGEKEERRLMYVAMTRAQDYLSINYCITRRKYHFGTKRNRIDICEPSPFLKEILRCDVAPTAAGA